MERQSTAPASAQWRPIGLSRPTESKQSERFSSSKGLPRVKRIPANVGPLKILDFDIETRRVGFFTAGKFAPDGCEPIAIACSWLDEARVDVVTLDETDSETMLGWFSSRYEMADIVTGHYIRKFDLPILNAGMLEHGLPLLGAKLISDTQGDLPRRGGLSASQENLAGMFGLRQSKVAVSDHVWRGAARLEPEAMEIVRERVVRDVRQHKALRAHLIAQGTLRPPRMWRP
jgi:DNA polymerase elongation subunit (family B)